MWHNLLREDASFLVISNRERERERERNSSGPPKPSVIHLFVLKDLESMRAKKWWSRWKPCDPGFEWFDKKSVYAYAKPQFLKGCDLPIQHTWATFFFFGGRFSIECCSNFCRESISPVFCWCAKPREATSESTYKSGKIVFAKALCVGYQAERFFHICFIRYTCM